jgi:hypothetical protein
MRLFEEKEICPDAIRLSAPSVSMDPWRLIDSGRSNLGQNACLIVPWCSCVLGGLNQDIIRAPGATIIS